MDYEDIDTQRVEGGQYCIADELIDNNLVSESKMDRCGSSDAMSTYENILPDGTVFYTSYCFSCSQKFGKKHFSNSSWAVEFGVEPASGKILEKKEFKRKPKAVRITNIEAREVIGYGNKGRGCRGIKNKYREFFGHRIRNGSDGRPKVIFYPETQEDGKLFGYKTRTLPKYFGYENKGITGIKSELAGQFKFKDQHFRDIVICAGEEDMVAFFQQFDEYQERRNAKTGSEYTPMPVVSPTTGEGSAYKQLQSQYDFINRAENIFIGFDADDVGRAAAAEVATLFPKDKVKIINWSLKDPNNAIRKDPKYNPEGKDYSAQTIRDFYDAKDYVKSGIISSIDADKGIEEELLRPKIPLPPFMSDLQKMMAGGVPLGYMVNFIAESGIGKSTLVNEAIRHMIFEAKYKVGILSLELSAAQYMIAMLSREVGTKINLFETPEEAVEFINRPDVLEARKHLKMNEYGEERFSILDEREGTLSEVKKQCEKLLNKHGCRILVIDPIQDLFEGVAMDEQNAFVKWMKGMLKDGVTFIDVCHVRKGNTSTDKEGRRILRELSEDDVHGISSVVKSAGANIFMSRNKYAEHNIEQNTTFVTLGKCRWTGRTGKCSPWYYDNASHTMFDLSKYFQDNPEKLGGYDLGYNPFTKEKSEGFSKKAGGGKNNRDIPEDDLFDNVPL